MNAETVQSERGDGAYLRLPVPIGNPDAFRHGATADVLHLLVDNPQRAFTNRELHRITGHGLSGVNGTVDTLDALGLVDVDRSGRANAVRINSNRLVKPDDPVTTIPQAEYHPPVRALLDRLDQELSADAGVVLFGSVAQGTADRASDIDLFVVVEEGRMRAQRDAHTIEEETAETRFDGDRYEPHIVVETQESAPDHDAISEILVEGITLRETPAVDAVKQEVFEGGA